MSREKTLTEREREQLRELIEDSDEHDVASGLGISAHTIVRALAGLPVQVATLELLRLHLFEVAR